MVAATITLVTVQWATQSRLVVPEKRKHNRLPFVSESESPPISGQTVTWKLPVCRHLSTTEDKNCQAFVLALSPGKCRTVHAQLAKAIAIDVGIVFSTNTRGADST